MAVAVATAGVSGKRQDHFFYTLLFSDISRLVEMTLRELQVVLPLQPPRTRPVQRRVDVPVGTRIVSGTWSGISYQTSICQADSISGGSVPPSRNADIIPLLPRQSLRDCTLGLRDGKQFDLVSGRVYPEGETA